MLHTLIQQNHMHEQLMCCTRVSAHAVLLIAFGCPPVCVLHMQGPLFSVRVAQNTFKSVWEMVNVNAVSGYGVDLAWCPYLYEQMGFRRDRTCAVVDSHPIDHIDSHSGTVSASSDQLLSGQPCLRGSYFSMV